MIDSDEQMTLLHLVLRLAARVRQLHAITGPVEIAITYTAIMKHKAINITKKLLEEDQFQSRSSR